MPSQFWLARVHVHFSELVDLIGQSILAHLHGFFNCNLNVVRTSLRVQRVDELAQLRETLGSRFIFQVLHLLFGAPVVVRALTGLFLRQVVQLEFLR